MDDPVLAGPVQTGGSEIVAKAEASPAADRIRFLGFVADEHLLGWVVFENSDVHVESWPRSVGCPPILTSN